MIVSGSGAARFREALEHHWGIANRLETLHQAVASLDSIIQQMIEERGGKMIKGITLYGFPLMFFVSVYSQTILTLDPTTGAIIPHWVAIAQCLGLTFITSLGLKWWLSHS